MPGLAKFKVTNCDLKQTRVDSIDAVKQQIFVIRSQRVMLDRDLAQLSGVTTKRLNEQSHAMAIASRLISLSG